MLRGHDFIWAVKSLGPNDADFATLHGTSAGHGQATDKPKNAFLGSNIYRMTEDFREI
jgi:hypothetical protein